MKPVRQSIAAAVWLLMPITFGVVPGRSAAENLVSNPGFENGVRGWTTMGDGKMFTATVTHSGSFSGLLTEREFDWFGIAQSMLGVMKNRKTYRISGWLRLDNAQSDNVAITVLQTDSTGTQFFHPASVTAYDDRWVELSGMFTLDSIGDLTALVVYFEGAAAGVNYYLDDVAIEEVNWKTEANKRIDRLRKRDVEVTVLSPAGEAAAGVRVQVTQKRHLFGFGSTIDANLVNNAKYGEFFRKTFEWAVPDAETKWTVNEPEPGQLNYVTADAIYDFANENDIKMRGHAIFWAGESFVQDWVRALSPADLEDAVRQRMTSVVEHFMGKFEHWEVNNEMLDGSFYKDRLGEIDGTPVRVWMFQRAHEIDPQAKLYLNEFGPISFGGKTKEYKALVRDLIKEGAPVDGIGLQCHTPANFNRGLYISRFETMAELGLPTWVTEFDVEQADEQYRANDLEDFYRIAFSQPSVQGIIMFGFWENAHWRPNGHIVNSDWRLNEAGRRYEALMDEWTTRTSVITDSEGKATFRGFHGTYDIVVAGADGHETTRTLMLAPGAGPARLTIRVEPGEPAPNGAAVNP